jgi:hypothetical protein
MRYIMSIYREIIGIEVGDYVAIKGHKALLNNDPNMVATIGAIQSRGYCNTMCRVIYVSPQEIYVEDMDDLGFIKGDFIKVTEEEYNAYVKSRG